MYVVDLVVVVENKEFIIGLLWVLVDGKDSLNVESRRHGDGFCGGYRLLLDSRGWSGRQWIFERRGRMIFEGGSRMLFIGSSKLSTSGNWFGECDSLPTAIETDRRCWNFCARG
jgi:hypothetical protein